ncbi:MAG: hypothetical protein AAB614_02095 [Patescibacteria group bacterium]
MNFSQTKGYTVVEVMISVFILIFLSSIGAIYYNSTQDDARLSTSSQNIISELNIAQSKTQASYQASSYGVHFENNQYVFFKGLIYSAADINNIFYQLPSNIEIVNISLGGGGSDIIFDRITGKTLNYGSLQVRVINNVSKLRKIIIESSGEADASSTVLTPSGTLISDSRHVHFTFAQDVTGALTLVLDFFDPVFTQTINFQDYLDAGKTSFSWSGTVNVGGVNQVIQIITHSLTPSSAEFSILRDLRYNTKAVSISLDGANLINYSASGIVTQGSSVNVNLPQAQ